MALFCTLVSFFSFRAKTHLMQRLQTQGNEGRSGTGSSFALTHSLAASQQNRYPPPRSEDLPLPGLPLAVGARVVTAFPDTTDWACSEGLTGSLDSASGRM